MQEIDQFHTLIAEIDALLDGAQGRREAPSPALLVAEPPPAAEIEPRRARTIVVVDDNDDYRGLVRDLLLGVPCYRVLEAPDGMTAMPVIRRALPDLVIVDFNMPKMNGYELVGELRRDPETRRIPIIMFTGATNRRHLKTIDMGLASFLEKPVPNRVLLDCVAKALRLDPPPRPAAAASAAAPAEPMRIERVASGARSEAVDIPVPSPGPEDAPAAEASVEPGGALEDESLEMLASEDKTAATEELGLETLANDSPLVTRVNRILLQAVDARASDIHIEPQEKHVTVRIRVDGSLKPLCSLPIALHPRLSARIKILASMVITERRLPQDGQFRVQIKGKKIEFRVSTLPCTYGEKIVMRILGQSKLKGSLAELEMSPRDRDSIERALKSPHGLVLVTGPTGSGKTTTLYTMIAMLNRPDVNIMTAEDPVEYEVPDISQVKVRPAIGLTFEAVLRSFLRQDPDIMLIGEIRDLETAEIAVKASITGHLVFSTLHTNSAPATVVRLTHMGVAPYLVAASVKLVVAQRLIRLLCPACREPVPVSDEDRKFLTEEEAAQIKGTFRRAGCPSCRQTGYAGRRPVFEVMSVQSAEMRQAISSGAGADLIAEQAAREGLTSLRRSAMDCAARGLSSLEDALKIVLGD